MSFAAQLRKAREKAGLTVDLAAKAAGVSPRTWAHWERGERLPPAERDAITRERLIARLAGKATPGNPNVRDEPRAKRVGSGPWLGASGASPAQDAEPTQQANDHP